MPFTPSHIAAVLPLVSSARVRRFVDPWALAIGAMVPDLPIFLPHVDFLLPDYTDWHSWSGVVTLDLAAVVVLLGLFHQVFRDPLISLLPPALAGRAATLAPSWRYVRLLPIVAGAVIGAGSHVLWDSFTHSTGPEEWGAWLGYRVLGVISLFRLLQYVSSIVGLAVVLAWVWSRLSAMAPMPVPGHLRTAPFVRVAVLVAAVAGTVAGAFLWPRYDPPSPRLGLPSVITKVGAGTVVGLCVVIACYALAWHAWRLVAVPPERSARTRLETAPEESA
ncbi:hypothetical protein FHU36_007849 [Nonomuraea muscovyensis]|uniref:DUF4184 family protein n=1 Tax=Nonomuraea muscovyensis TaxID=1124761 RepID=A0A7X0CCJ6_9ACTN|nr:DUF4184 family protein [Nonomuraea muscovyensis]MBB6351266.1 hypothetical protein [Nonomuraea muscovyensis]